MGEGLELAVLSKCMGKSSTPWTTWNTQIKPQQVTIAHPRMVTARKHTLQCPDLDAEESDLHTCAGQHVT